MAPTGCSGSWLPPSLMAGAAGSRRPVAASTFESCCLWAKLHGMRYKVIRRAAGEKGIAVLPHRRVVECSFG
jgi:hypothetical protein